MYIPDIIHSFTDWWFKLSHSFSWIKATCILLWNGHKPANRNFLLNLFVFLKTTKASKPVSNFASTRLQLCVSWNRTDCCISQSCSLRSGKKKITLKIYGLTNAWTMRLYAHFKRICSNLKSNMQRNGFIFLKILEFITCKIEMRHKKVKCKKKMHALMEIGKIDRKILYESEGKTAKIILIPAFLMHFWSKPNIFSLQLSFNLLILKETTPSVQKLQDFSPNSDKLHLSARSWPKIGF